MSEYQYYEFQAVDRCLTEQEIEELRACSSRAEITRCSFINEYSWGSFKGEKDRWMEKYFDGFLYYANWGTHSLKLRLPAALLDFNTVQAYCNARRFSARLSGDKIILSFSSEIENHWGWEEGRRLAPFLSLRRDLSSGDLRCLYLGWLSGIQSDRCDQEMLEPPVPPGLQDLNTALTHFADFLRIDRDLIQAAAINSPPLESKTPDSQDLRMWIAALPPQEKDDLLVNVLTGSMEGDQTAAFQQVGRFYQTWQSLQQGKQEGFKRRTVEELRKKAKEVGEMRKGREAEKAAAE